jgi:RNA polymerase sigma factor (sigma-70 family)
MKSDKILTGVEVVQATTEQDQVTPPNDKEIYKICKVLANKYNSPNHYDDLISEGLVACYECRESGKARKADYVGSARRAMNDYINIKTKAVSIPSTWASRTVGNQISRGGGLEGLEGVKGGTLFQLFTAMSNGVTEVDKAQVSTKDHAESYETADYQEYVVSVAKKTLTQEEMKIVILRYWKNMTQDEVGLAMNKSQKWVSRQEKLVLGKIRASLCNNL